MLLNQGVANHPGTEFLTHGLGAQPGGSVSDSSFALSTVSACSWGVSARVSHSFQPGSINQSVCIIPTWFHSSHRNSIYSCQVCCDFTPHQGREGPHDRVTSWSMRTSATLLAVPSFFLSSNHLHFPTFPSPNQPTNSFLFFHTQTPGLTCFPMA